MKIQKSNQYTKGENMTSQTKSQFKKHNLLLTKMIRIVTDVYRGKLDHKNKAAILQPIKVMLKLAREDTEVRMIAIAKDILKESDGKVTLTSLRQEGFSERVVLAIDLLDQKKGDSFYEYINKVAKNPDTALVKKFDLKYHPPRKEADILKMTQFTKDDALAFLSHEKDSDKDLSIHLSEMIALAAKTHENQLDKGDNAYILHPFRVMKSLSNEDIEVQIIAVGHDVIEDSDGKVTVKTIEDMGFTKRVVVGMKTITHWDGVPYDVYVVEINKNPDTRMVKKGDICDNSNVTRIKGIRDKDHTRNTKYNLSYWYLNGGNEEEYLEKVKDFI